MDPDNLLDEINFIGHSTDQRAEDAIASVLLRLPEDVGLWALRNLYFLCPEDILGTAYEFAVPVAPAPAGEINLVPVLLVFIAWDCVNGPEDQLVETVAHEIAHHWLRHGGIARGFDEQDRHEREVERQLVEWGFK